MNDFQNNNMNQPPQGSKKGLGVASLVLGIVSIVLMCIWYIAVPSAIVAIVLGVLARKDPESRGFGTAGMVTGIVGIVFSGSWVLFLGAVIAGLGML